MTTLASDRTDPFDPGSLHRAYRKTLKRVIRAAGFGRPFRFLGEITSTNDQALDWAQEGAPEGALVVAASQTRGRGRAGRSWQSGPGAGLWFSVVLRPGLSYPEAGMLAPALGFGVVWALRELGLPAELKWPNDIILRGRKVGGLLVESRWAGDNMATAVAGLGVNWVAPDLGPESARAAGLANAFAPAEPPPPEVVLVRLIDHIEKAYCLLQAAGPAPFVKTWPAVSAHLGRLVTVLPATADRDERTLPLPATPFAGSALAGRLLADGSLEVLDSRGTRASIIAADVSLAWPVTGDDFETESGETNSASPAY